MTKETKQALITIGIMIAMAAATLTFVFLGGIELLVDWIY